MPISGSGRPAPNQGRFLARFRRGRRSRRSIVLCEDVADVAEAKLVAPAAANRPTISESANVSTTLRLGLAMHLCVALSGCANAAWWPRSTSPHRVDKASSHFLSVHCRTCKSGRQSDRCRVADRQGASRSIRNAGESYTNRRKGRSASTKLDLATGVRNRRRSLKSNSRRTSIEGSLNITDRSVSFVPPPWTTSVRIPYELVQDVEVSRSVVAGGPRSMIGEILLWALRHRQFPAS